MKIKVDIDKFNFFEPVTSLSNISVTPGQSLANNQQTLPKPLLQDEMINFSNLPNFNIF